MTLAIPSILETVQRGSVLYLTLNRPERRNALSAALLDQLGATLGSITANHDVHVVVLQAAGTIFSSGHDLSEMRGRSESEYQTLFARCSRVMQMLRQLPQPVIAKVQGLATAAGCQLAAACDLVVASETASFATPGVKIGLFCTTPMVPLVRVIPERAAMEMLLTGEPISARRAYELTLVNRVVPAAELDAAVDALAETLAASSPTTLALGKRAFYDQLTLSERDAYSAATRVMTQNVMQRDAQEGITAFFEKRSPQWSPREKGR